MIEIQAPDGKGWKTVAHRTGSEMDFPEPVSANEIGATPKGIYRLALTEHGRIIRKRMMAAVS